MEGSSHPKHNGSADYGQLEANVDDEPVQIQHQSIDLIEFYLAQMFAKVVQLLERIFGHNMRPKPRF